MMGEEVNMHALSRERAVAQFSNSVLAEQYRPAYDLLTKTNMN